MRYLIFLILFYSFKVQADSIRIGLRYSFKTAYSTVDNKVPVKELYSVLKNKNINKIYIYGHTDWIASDQINQSLSEARAKSILNLLVKYGINKSNIEVEGFGKKQPIADNTTEDGRAQNRRVSVVIPNISREDLDKIKTEVEKSTHLYIISIESEPVKEVMAVVESTLPQETKPVVEESTDLNNEAEPSKSEVSENFKSEKQNDIKNNKKRYHLGLGLSQSYLTTNDITGPGLGINAYWVSQVNYNFKFAYQWQMKPKFWLGLSAFAEFQNYFNQDNPSFSWDEKDPYLFGLAIISNYDLSKFSFGADIDLRQIPFIQENSLNVTLDKEWVYNLKLGSKYKLFEDKDNYSSRIGLDLVLALGGLGDYNPKSNPLGVAFNIDLSKRTFNNHEWLIGLNYLYIDYDHDYNTQSNQQIGIDFMLRSDLWF